MKIISSSFLVLSLFAFYSCTKNLNQSPAYGLNSEVVYSDPNNYINVLSKALFWLVNDGTSRTRWSG